MPRPIKKNAGRSYRGLPVTDYYLDKSNGSVVFTESYHLKRGYCCHKKCRHCPWAKAAGQEEV
jgi:hypothetical protein